MAHVTYSGLTDGATRSAALYNALFTPFQTQSTNLTQPNMRDEGLDTNTLASGIMTDGRDQITYNAGNVALAAAAGGAVLNPGATGAFTLTNLAAGWIVGQNVGRVRVTFGVQMQYTYGAHPAGNSPAISFKIQYQEDGGALTTVPNSEWTYSGNDQVSLDASTATTYYTPAWYEAMAYDWDIPHTLDGAQHTINQVNVTYTTASAAINVNNIWFRAVRFLKAVT